MAHSDALPLNFPQTFLPERRLLAQLLPFATMNGQGDKVSIGLQTNIPTGASTGKVEPIIRYAEGMGMVTTQRASGVWQLGLTPLGRLIFQEDAFLSEAQTLWLLHLMLSRRHTLTVPAVGVADSWFALFAEGVFRLGNRFTQKNFLEFLMHRHGDKGYLKSLSGIVIRSYLEDSCFGRINALQEDAVNGEKFLIRQSAPFKKSFFPAYAAYLCLIWDELFPNEKQVSLDLFSIQSRCFSVMAWDETRVAGWLDWMVDQGIIQVDRYTGSPILLRVQGTDKVIDKIYDSMT